MEGWVSTLVDRRPTLDADYRLSAQTVISNSVA